MLPKMCRKLACMNIELKAVTHVAGCDPGLATNPARPWQATAPAVPPGEETVASAQWSPGWVNS